MDTQTLLPPGTRETNPKDKKTPVDISPRPTAEDAKHDVDVLLWSMKLCSIRRYFHQRFWEKETLEAEHAERVEPMPRLETVAEHSWQVADAALLLADHFPYLDAAHCAELAILHDKMEITIGDQNPVGRDGTGRSTHAFSLQKKRDKESAERAAIVLYVSRLRPSIRRRQSRILYELLEGTTQEARFVKAVDKLQALAFVLIKKRGELLDKHLEFTLAYSEKVTSYFPPLDVHYCELRSRLLLQVARRRNCSVKRIEELIRSEQLPLGFEKTRNGNQG